MVSGVGIVSSRIRRRIVLMTALLSIGLGGCAGQKAKLATPVFFPPDPNPPRIQYLKGINGSKDIVEEKAGFSLFSFGKQEEEVVKNIAKPYGIVADKGKIYVVDTIQNDITIVDPAKKFYQTLVGNRGMGKLRKPINLAVASDGGIYVADAFRKEIVVYDAQGNYVQAFGKDIDMKPVDVAVDNDNIYALDITHNEIKVLNRKDGQYQRSIGKSTETEQGLSMPTNLTMDSKGFLYVTNTGSGQVVKLDRDGHFIQRFGKMGDAFAEFGRPRGITVDNDGRIYVADASHQNVQIFNDKGRLLMFFCDPGFVEGSCNLPAGVTFSTDNLEYYQKFAEPNFILEGVIFVANQFGPVKVGVYGLGHLKGTQPPSNYEEPAKPGEKKAEAAKAAATDKK